MGKKAKNTAANKPAKKKRRRSPAEKKLAKQIDKLAKTKQPDLEALAKAERYSEAAVRSKRFETNRSHSTVDQLPIHYFHKQGETVTGILGEPSTEVPWRALSYPFKLDDGRVIRLPGNRRLRKAIDKAKAVGLRVEIRYEGKLFLWGHHYEKVFTIKLKPKPNGKAQPAGNDASKPPGKDAWENKDEARAWLRSYIEKRHGYSGPVALLRMFEGEPWADEILAKMEGERK